MHRSFAVFLSSLALVSQGCGGNAGPDVVDAVDDVFATRDGSIDMGTQPPDVLDATPGHDTTVVPDVVDAGTTFDAGDAGTAGDAGWLKPACTGLMTRSGTPPTGFPWLDHAVAQVNWSTLEPMPGVFTGTGWAEIDAIRALPTHPGIRIRVLAGDSSPGWVRHLGGAPVSQPATDAGPAIDCSSTGGIATYNAFDGVSACVPYFWTTAYLDAYEGLMMEIARRYDSDPQVLEIVDSACMTTYAEVFYRAHADRETNLRLATAGLTHAADLACQTRALRIHATHFVHTRTSLAINGWDEVNTTAAPYFQNSWPDTFAFVTTARHDLGARLELQNNGFDAMTGTCAASASPATDFNCYLASIGGPKGYQTRTWARLGGTPMGLYDALTLAVSQGMNSIELPSGWMAADSTRLGSFDAMLDASPCCAP